MKKILCVILMIVFTYVLAFASFAAGATYDHTNSTLTYYTVGYDGYKYTYFSPGEWPAFYDYVAVDDDLPASLILFDLPLTENLAVGENVSVDAYFPASLVNLGVATVSLNVYGSAIAHVSRAIYTMETGEARVVTSGLPSSKTLNNPTCKIISDGDIIGLNISGVASKEILRVRLVIYGEFSNNIQATLNYTSGGKTYYPLAVNPSSDQPGDPDVPAVSGVTVYASSLAPYYPGTEVQLNAQVSGTNIEPGSPESTVYWYVHGNTSDDTYIDNDGLLIIANDEMAASLEIEVISTYDSTKSATLELPITYPLEGVQIIPSGEQQFVQSDKQRTIQYQLLLPNGDPYDYQLIEWYAKPTPGHESYFRIDDTGLLTIEPDAPVGSGCTIQFAYQNDISALSPVGASVKIISQLDGIIDGITPTPEQTDKADQMEDAIGNAADKLENNNSSLGQLTPTRPQINTKLELDQEYMFAVSPLVTNIWSINGLGRMISIVLVVATVAYIFFGKRDG